MTRHNHGERSLSFDSLVAQRLLARETCFHARSIEELTLLLFICLLFLLIVHDFESEEGYIGL
jgi:hypothetical protein